MNLEECYEAMDSDYDDVMRRFGSETLVRKFVLKFLDDTSFQGLKKDLKIRMQNSHSEVHIH